PWTSIQGEHGTMALYYALLGPWSTISTDLRWIRLLSFLLVAVALVTFCSVLTRRLGARVAAWGTLFAACSTIVVRLAGEARAFGLVALLVVVGWWALDRALDRPDDRLAWPAFWACALLLPFAHGVAIIQVASQVLTIACVRPGRRVVVRAAIGLGLSLAAMLVLWSSGISAEGTFVGPTTWGTVDLFVQNFVSPYPVLALGLAVALVAATWRSVRSAALAPTPAERFGEIMFLFWGLGSLAMVFVASEVRPVAVARYAMASAIGLAGLLAAGLRQRDGTGLRPVLGGVVLVLLLPSALVGGQTGSATWSAAAEAVTADVRPDDAFAFPGHDARLPFEAAWRDAEGGAEHRVVGSTRPIGSLQRYASTATDAELADALSRAAAPRVWLVGQPRARTDPLDTFLTVLPEGYDVAERWSFPSDVQVVLLVRE
ncbi:MAG TPA: hypothetical protein VHK88_02525, partial [Aquihabitans sp.]|nr:hypothetical protein [Aquihabitans sp.]